ncbi:MAG TPA: universal stress protein [Desulfosarcina sp.]|nr:universal stress protein [Desulfosarcina sp.]
MNYKNVLVLTDFSEDAYEAVRTAVDFAEKFAASLTILHVIRDSTPLSFVLSDTEYHSLGRKLEKHAGTMFDRMDAAIPELNKVGYNRKIRTGTPYISCLYEIENGSYDLVIAGSHGRTGLRQTLMGSTSEKVVRRSPISTFVVRR